LAHLDELCNFSVTGGNFQSGLCDIAAQRTAAFRAIFATRTRDVIARPAFGAKPP